MLGRECSRPFFAFNSSCTLKHPVTLANGETLASVTLRRPTVGDMLAAKVKRGTQDAEGEVRLLAKLCNLNIEDFTLIDMADYFAIQDALLSFLGREEPAALQG